jgi:hypothetical protein
MWDGNYYALEMTKRLGLEDSDGMVRVGPVHYNQAPGFWVRSPRTLGNSGGDPAVRGGVGKNYKPGRLKSRLRHLEHTYSPNVNARWRTIWSAAGAVNQSTRN